MGMKGMRRMLLGEKMPDKDDPKYKERYEKEVDAGRRFAKATRIDRAAEHVQRFANMHTKLFLVIVFGFVVSCFALNIYRMAKVYHCNKQSVSAVAVQDSVLKVKSEERRVKNLSE